MKYGINNIITQNLIQRNSLRSRVVTSSPSKTRWVDQNLCQNTNKFIGKDLEYFFTIDTLNFELSQSIESSLRSLSTLVDF